ncbi:MAG: hypothetical protein WC155_00120 [Candidatus Cloacimonadales bacterium]
MTKSVKVMIIIAVMLGLVSALIADNNHNNSELRMGYGAKGMAMGGTGTAYMNDITAAYWNPAGLAKIVDYQVGIDYMDGIGLDRNTSFAGMGMRFKHGYMAVSWLNAGATDFDGYDDFGTSTGSYDYQKNNINLSLATRTGKFLWGSSIKMMFDNINDDKQNGFGIDLGTMYEMNEYISFGAHVRDVFSKFNKVSVPMQYNLGVAIFPVRGLTVSGDLRQEESSKDITVHMGAEYWTNIGSDTESGTGLGTMRNSSSSSWENMLSEVQAGVRIGANDGQFTAGFGIRFRVVEMNYAFVKEDSSGINKDNHRYGLTFRF